MSRILLSISAALVAVAGLLFARKRGRQPRGRDKGRAATFRDLLEDNDVDLDI